TSGGDPKLGIQQPFRTHPRSGQGRERLTRTATALVRLATEPSAGVKAEAGHTTHGCASVITPDDPACGSGLSSLFVLPSVTVPTTAWGTVFKPRCSTQRAADASHDPGSVSGSLRLLE